MFFRRPRKPSVLLTELGNRNTGDEALYAASVRRFHEAGWQITLLHRVRPRDDVLAIAPVSLHELRVEDRFDGIAEPDELCAEFSRRHPAAWQTTCDLVRAHDLVAVAPGGRFTDGYNNPRALLTAVTALRHDVPLVQLHQSFGPMEAADHRALLLAVLHRSRLTVVRDDCSHAFLERSGLPGERMVLARDATLAEPFPRPPEPQFDVGLNLRHGFNGRVQPEVVRQFLTALKAERPDLEMLLYSTTHALDEAMQRAAEGLATTRIEVPSWSERARDPGLCRVNITDSFHGMIFSMQAGRPVVACRTDFATWKIEGTTAPGTSATEVHSGLACTEDIPRLLACTLAALDRPSDLLERQQRLLHHGRTLAEAGWRKLFETVADLGGKRP